jgi:hypothetical protein
LSAIRLSREWLARLSRERVDDRLRRDWEIRRERHAWGGVDGGAWSSSILGRRRTSSSSLGVVSRPLLPPRDDDDDVAAAAVAPVLQILPPGSGTIVGSHLAAIDGHLRRCRRADGGAPTTITTATTSIAVALLDSLGGESSGEYDGNNAAAAAAVVFDVGSVDPGVTCTAPEASTGTPTPFPSFDRSLLVGPVSPPPRRHRRCRRTQA